MIDLIICVLFTNRLFLHP